jgi:hypothetical protein
VTSLQEISERTNDTAATVDDSKQSFEDEGEVSPERLQTRLKQLKDILSGVSVLRKNNLFPPERFLMAYHAEDDEKLSNLRSS